MTSQAHCMKTGYKNNLKVRLMVLLFCPPRCAPHLIEKLPFLLVNILLLYIPLLALNNRQTDLMRDNKYIHCAWAGEVFLLS